MIMKWKSVIPLSFRVIGEGALILTMQSKKYMKKLALQRLPQLGPIFWFAMLLLTVSL